MKNQTVKRIIAVAACAALLTGGIGATVYALADRTQEQTAPAAEPPAAVPQAETPAQSGGLNKDETVYVLAGADGTVQKIIVSDWIQNTPGSATVTDKTELTDLTVVKGEATYTLGDDHMTVWDAQGNDIYYQGRTEKELPVGLTVSYQLDGQPIAAADIAGKSGRVTIRFAYENRRYETVEIDGKQEKIYVPFVMLTGMLLDNDRFRNVEVTNGKRINDGDRTAVIGFALPGWQETLGLQSDLLSLPDFVEITADVTDFRFGMTVTLATNELLRSSADLTDDLSLNPGELLGQLTDGIRQLTDGSSALYAGLLQLLNKSGELADGVEALAEGARLLAENAGPLQDGADQVRDGAAALQAGLQALSAQNDTLNNASRQVFETLLSTVTEELGKAGLSVPPLTADNYADALNELIFSLDVTSTYKDVLQPLLIQTAQRRPEIVADVGTSVHDRVSAQIIAAETGMTVLAYNAAVTAGQVPAATQKAIEAAIRAQMNSAAVQQEIQAAADRQATLLLCRALTADATKAKLQGVFPLAQQLVEAKLMLDGYNAFYLGLLLYTDGVTTAADGAGQLAEGCDLWQAGMAQFKAGTEQLYDGILQLKNNLPALIDGVGQLTDGAMQLSDGMQKLAGGLLDDVFGSLLEGGADLLPRLQAMLEVSRQYGNFAGLADGTDGQVKFIYRTAEI